MDNNSEGSGCDSSHCNLQEINSMPLLGMTLEKSESLVRLLESRLAKEHHQPLSEKLKASNFPITTISVGNWQRVSRHQGELTGKMYYAKKKLVWEFLDGQLKSKMEVSWSDITAIEAVMQPHQPGYIQIELRNPPLFFRETTPQPRKHTNWQQASDFTDGQAPLYRRHFVTFPSGALDRHYEKLLQSDQHLFQLSRRPFPTHQSPFFNTVLPLQNLHFTITGLQQQQPSTASLHPTLNPTMTAVTARNSGVAAVWGNQINNEAIFVDSSRPSGFPHHQQQQHYEYDETTVPYMEIPSFNQNPIISPISYPDHSAIHCGQSDEHLMQMGDDDGKRSRLLDQMMEQNAAKAGDDGESWSLLDQIMMQNGDDHGSWLGEQVMKQNAVPVAGGDDSWLAPHIQGISNHDDEIIDDDLPITRNLYPNHRFT